MASITPKLKAAAVLLMNGPREVTNSRFVVGINPTLARNLVTLGWATLDIEWPRRAGERVITFVALTEEGKNRAAEIVAEES
jgi:hypothetical protein